MRSPTIAVILFASWAAGCAGPGRPVEVLDERTGITLGALKEPIELVPPPANAVVPSHGRTTFAYLGPVEWNRSGDLSYGMWIHIAPGNDKAAGDIHAPGAVVLLLDEGPQTLSLIEAPKNAREPYRPAVPWGQTVYFDLTVGALRRMAASRRFELDVRAVDGAVIDFSPTRDTRSILSEYLRARGITVD
jgi:hypothetical protein